MKYRVTPETCPGPPAGVEQLLSADPFSDPVNVQGYPIYCVWDESGLIFRAS